MHEKSNFCCISLPSIAQLDTASVEGVCSRFVRDSDVFLSVLICEGEDEETCSGRTASSK